MSDDFSMRPFDFDEDYDGVVALLDLVFEEELSAKGITIQSVFSEYKSMKGLFNFMGKFSGRFRNLFDGFVIENQARDIIASVNIGRSVGYWEISMVATHPDYRRRGLARRLVNRAIAHAKEHGAKICVLEVIDTNTPAYELYKNLGFTHFDSITKMKIQPDNLSDIEVTPFPDGYTLSELKRDKATNQGRYDLALRSTPESVQEYTPIQMSRYRNPLIKRIFRPIVFRLSRGKMGFWTVSHSDTVVASIFSRAARSEESTHELEIDIDPKHSATIMEPIITYALDFFKNAAISSQALTTRVRSSDLDQIEMVKRYGFEAFETDHILGLRIE